ncbi:RagB/SusD family nutrient uptake outer membrane protein [Bacteroides ovatus]|nr:RagB/SusD family nutrient uptake outer membrane protein [Bacteroides ovatus]
MKAFGTEISTTAPSEFKYASRVGQNITDRNVLFPIPNTEITVNKLMTQNEVGN